MVGRNGWDSAAFGIVVMCITSRFMVLSIAEWGVMHISMMLFCTHPLWAKRAYLSPQYAILNAAHLGTSSFIRFFALFCVSFVRYADDCIIMVGSEMSANRVMRNISRYTEEKLGLKVKLPILK